MIKSKKGFGVYGDYAYAHEKLLFESDKVDEAIGWAIAYTSLGSAMSGYNIVEVAFHNRNNEYTPVWKVEVEEDEGVLFDEF
jgi:hypothetical protein